MIRSSVLGLAVAALVSTGLATAPAPASGATVHAGPSASAKVKFCDRDSFRTKLRKVRGNVVVDVSRMSVRTYPGRTRIHKGESVTTGHRRTFSAKVSHTVGATFSAGAMLKKVVNVFGEVTGETSFTGRYASTRSEQKTVTSDTTVTIPGGKSVVWFVAHKVVSGSFEYSTCDALDGHDQETGVKRWRAASWTSFAIRDDGGQRCDLKAQTSGAKVAKAIGCA